MARILVADDDISQLQIRARILEAAGYEVDVAFSPSEALRYLAAADAIVMDLRFLNPDLQPDDAEGLKLIRQIRDSGSRAPILVLSGWADSLTGTAEERLVSRILLKPIGAGEMLAALASCLTAVAAPARNPL